MVNPSRTAKGRKRKRENVEGVDASETLELDSQSPLHEARSKITSETEFVVNEDSDVSSGESEDDGESESMESSKLILETFPSEFPSDKTLHTTVVEHPQLDRVSYSFGGDFPSPGKLSNSHFTKEMREQWASFHQPGESNFSLTPLQTAILPILGCYRDLLFCRRTRKNAEELRNLCIAHIMNHVIVNRAIVLKNNKRIRAVNELQGLPVVAEPLRDSGYARPRILIIAPFRNVAADIVATILNVTPPRFVQTVRNLSKFEDEYGGVEDKQYSTVKPADFMDTFRANVDDCFRIGIKVTKRSIKLFTDFFGSDIIIASPLGLRLVIGDAMESEKHGDRDFLSSIEICLVEGAEVLLMQNWEHLVSIFSVLNAQPKDHTRVPDFSRVRLSILDGNARKLRQTIVLSAFRIPEVNSLFSSYCSSWRGVVKVGEDCRCGALELLAPRDPPLRHVFFRLESESAIDDCDVRFEYFKKKILPVFRRNQREHEGVGNGGEDGGKQVGYGTILFIPSYFDYVRVRNALNEADIRFVSLHDYATPAEISRVRSWFFHGQERLLVMTERFHFFHRYVVKGGNSVFFYGIPLFRLHVPEVVNMLDVLPNGSSRVFYMYSRFERFALERLLGKKKASTVLAAKADTHMLA